MGLCGPPPSFLGPFPFLLALSGLELLTSFSSNASGIHLDVGGGGGGGKRNGNDLMKGRRPGLLTVTS